MSKGNDGIRRPLAGEALGIVLRILSTLSFAAMGGASRASARRCRSVMGACAMFTSFATIRLLPLAEATLLSYLSPVLLALLAWSLLGERLSRRRIGGIVRGLCGGAAFVLPAVSGDLTERASSALERGSRPPF